MLIGFSFSNVKNLCFFVTYDSKYLLWTVNQSKYTTLSSGEL